MKIDSSKVLTPELESNLRFLIAAEIHRYKGNDGDPIAADYVAIVELRGLDNSEMQIELLTRSGLIVGHMASDYLETLAYVTFSSKMPVIASYWFGPCSTNGELLDFSTKQFIDLRNVTARSFKWIVHGTTQF